MLQVLLEEELVAMSVVELRQLARKRHYGILYLDELRKDAIVRIILQEQSRRREVP